MKNSTKRLLTLAAYGAGLGLVNAAAALQEAPAATGQRSFPTLSAEQQQAQQAIDNKIRRVAPIDLGAIRPGIAIPKLHNRSSKAINQHDS